MAVERYLDTASLAEELGHLRRRQDDLRYRHDKLSERMAAFPNDFGLAWARSLADEIEVLDAGIRELEGLLLPDRN